MPPHGGRSRCSSDSLPELWRARCSTSPTSSVPAIFSRSAHFQARQSMRCSRGLRTRSDRRLLRLLTGMFLAGVYPPAMKIIATWFRTDRGFALGVLIGGPDAGKGIALSGQRHRLVELACERRMDLDLCRDRRRAGVDPARRAVCASQPAVRHHADHQRVSQSRRAAGELRIFRTYVGAIRHVDVGTGDVSNGDDTSSRRSRIVHRDR